jgi:hypothetical protein
LIHDFHDRASRSNVIVTINHHALRLLTLRPLLLTHFSLRAVQSGLPLFWDGKRVDVAAGGVSTPPDLPVPGTDLYLEWTRQTFDPATIKRLGPRSGCPG